MAVVPIATLFDVFTYIPLPVLPRELTLTPPPVVAWVLMSRSLAVSVMISMPAPALNTWLPTPYAMPVTRRIPTRAPRNVPSLAQSPATLDFMDISLSYQTGHGLLSFDPFQAVP